MATLAPRDAASAMTNQHQALAFVWPERSRRQATTSSRSTETGYAYAFHPS
ncbi:hypothetical protein QFZ49_004350 [Streptomyces turgidiscabies]|uniref:Uncharacterized protein n=1 Tax=Streptomyces turgidiscabies TaxID=85558 RepID=A0ABU0RU06_9ACTN|nr:hypothetical protein [Streptomyces turgidiscabies]